MAEFPALPLWTDALVADTNHLGDDEFGRYMRLLILIWRSPECRIPNDKAWVEKRLTPAVWPIIEEFCQRDGNWITQKRLLREWQYVKKMSQKNSEAAKSRWRNKKPPSERIVLASKSHRSGNAPTPTPTPIPSKKKVTPPTAAFPGWWPMEAWEGFAEMRKRIRAPLTARATELLVAKVTELKTQGQDPQKVIDQSTQRGWRGLFEVKKENGNGHARNGHNVEPAPIDGWVARLKVFHGLTEQKRGTWVENWGPKPDELGNSIPAEALRRFNAEREGVH